MRLLEFADLKPRVQGSASMGHRWEFPIIRSTLFWGPFNKDPTI